MDRESETEPPPKCPILVLYVGVILRRVRPIGVVILLRVGVLLRGFLTTNGRGRERGPTTVGATSRVGHFTADDLLGVDKLEPEEPSLPTKGVTEFPGRGFDNAEASLDFPLSRDLAGSKPALISKLDARPGVVASLVRVEGKIVERRLLMQVRSSWFSMPLDPMGRLELGLAFWNFQRRTGGPGGEWVYKEGSSTHPWSGVSPSEPFDWHAVPCMPFELPKSGHPWTYIA